MNEPSPTDSVVKEIDLDASPETVFGYFTEPEKLTRWLCSEATTDPRPGGINLQTHPGGHEGAPEAAYRMKGEFLEVDFPHRVVFSWGYENEDLGVPPGTTMVEVELTPQGGGTRLRLTHSRITAVYPRENYARGWDAMLERLSKLSLE